MDALPVLFYESVLPYFQINSIEASKRLTGVVGQVASEIFENGFIHRIAVTNGQLKEDLRKLAYRDAKDFDVEGIRSKYNKQTRVVVRARSSAYRTDPEMIKKLPTATRGKNIHLWLYTSHISKELELWINSLSSLHTLLINARITDLIQRIVRRVVEKKMLGGISFKINEPLDPPTVQLLVDLFKQDQFVAAHLSNDALKVIKQLINSWTSNSTQIAGKFVWCENVSASILRSTKFGFVDCGEEERRYVATLYPVAQGKGPKRWPTGQPFRACVLRSPIGHVIYWLFPENEAAQSLVLFV